MEALYTRLYVTASRMITKYGQAVTWKTLTDGTVPDATKPWAAGSITATNHTVRIAFFPEDRLFQETQHLIKISNRGDEFTAQSTGSVIGYMAAQSFTPTVKDVITRGSIEYRVETLKEYNVNGQSLLWIVKFFT